MRGLSDKEMMLIDFNKLENDIKSLKMAKNTLLKEQDSQITKNSKLVEEEIKLTEVIKTKTNEANETAKAIIEKAKSIEKGINKKNSEATTKLGEALEFERKAKDLIKSNEGLEKSLKADKLRVKELEKKLNTAKTLLIETLGG